MERIKFLSPGCDTVLTAFLCITIMLIWDLTSTLFVPLILKGIVKKTLKENCNSNNVAENAVFFVFINLTKTNEVVTNADSI